jgi:general stress protein YciG
MAISLFDTYIYGDHPKEEVAARPLRLDEQKECTVNETRKERRGFASMSPEKQREIASKGGRAAHQKGTAHEWSSDEAREAGRKGGMASRGGRGKLPMSNSSDVDAVDNTDNSTPEPAA